jgi:hypothetical protein
MKRGLALFVVGLWAILQTTKGPLAEKLGLIASKSASPGSATPGPISGEGTGGNPGGTSLWQPTGSPPGAPPGSYRVDQNGNYEVKSGGIWVPYMLGTTVPGAI